MYLHPLTFWFASQDTDCFGNSIYCNCSFTEVKAPKITEILKSCAHAFQNTLCSENKPQTLIHTNVVTGHLPSVEESFRYGSIEAVQFGNFGSTNTSEIPTYACRIAFANSSNVYAE